MKITTIFLFILFTSVKSNAQIAFQKQLSGFEGPGTYITDGKPTDDGGYILCGGTGDFIGYRYAYLAKLNDHGDTTWTKTFEVGDHSIAYAVQQTFDSGYVLGGVIFGSLAPGYNFIIKTDANGDTLWTWTNFRQDGPALLTIIQTLDSGYVLVGYSHNYSNLSKLDKNGTVIWSKVLGKPNNNLMARDIVNVKQTSDSGFIFCGYCNDSSFYSYKDSSLYNNIYLVKTDALGDTLWTKRFRAADSSSNSSSNATDILQTADDGYLITGSTTSSGNSYMFAIRTDAYGDTLWTRKYGTDSVQCYGSKIEATSDGGYIIIGNCNIAPGSRHIVLIKINTYGDTLWTRSFGIAYATAVAGHQAKDGGYFIAGYETPSPYRYNGYIVKTDSLGHSCYEYSTNLVVSSYPIQPTIGYSDVVDTALLYGSFPFYVSSGGIDSTICISVGIEEPPKFDNPFSLYPNPFADRASLVFKEEQKNTTITIADLLGKEIRKIIFTGKQFIIEKGQMRNGIYFVHVIDDKKNVVNKMIVAE